MVSTLDAAQKGNILIEFAMKRKQLSLHPGKCSILAFEKKNKVGQIRELINSGNSIKIGNQPILAKVKEEYLGDIIHEAGSLRVLKLQETKDKVELSRQSKKSVQFLKITE